MNKIHQIKLRDGYDFDEHDTRFKSSVDIIKLALATGVAGLLIGMTGIAGGMVLGPLLLSYNMLPTVMTSTNQYITMVASISVIIQFIYHGQLQYIHAFIFGGITLVFGAVGIKVVNRIIEKSGK